MTGNPPVDFHYGRWLLRYKLPPVLGILACSRKGQNAAERARPAVQARRQAPNFTENVLLLSGASGSTRQCDVPLRTCILGLKVTRIKI